MSEQSCAATSRFRRFAPTCLALLIGAGGALAAMRPAPAVSQSQQDVLGSGALALAAYAESRDQCVYSDKLGKALADVDIFVGRLRGSEWEDAKRLAPNLLNSLRNTARVLGARSDCVALGNAIGSAMPLYFNAAPLDVEVLSEFSRLLEGKGRSKSGEDEARQLPPPAPGSVAEINSRVSENSGKGSQIGNEKGGVPQRLPPNDPSSPKSVPQPAPRRSAELPSQLSPNTSREAGAAYRTPPLVQLAPLTLPEVAKTAPLAPVPLPNSVGPDVQVPIVDCKLGGVCRIAEPAFACNYDEAARLAEAGPTQGREEGIAAVRAGKCETVTAGRLLRFETTKSLKVAYVTEQGRHVGYVPTSVTASASSASTTTCKPPGFCAVRPGGPVWACPSSEGLGLPTNEARASAKCVQFGEGNAGEVVAHPSGDGPVSVRFGSGAGYQPSYYVARVDLIGIALSTSATPAYRGWCKPGDWCVTSAATLFCADYAAYERVVAAPVGEPRRTAITTESSCRIVVRGNPMKPVSPPDARDPNKLVAVEHPVFKNGWVSADAFKAVAYAPPVVYTSLLSDFGMGGPRTAGAVAFTLRGQGTSEAAATFGDTPKTRQEHCVSFWERDQPGFAECMNEPPLKFDARANCRSRRVVLNGRAHALELKGQGTKGDDDNDDNREYFYRDLKTGKRLDGSNASGESFVATALDVLCPGLVSGERAIRAYRDPKPEFPRELRGRWFADRASCADPARNGDGYEGRGVIDISGHQQGGAFEHENGFRPNVVRQVGRTSWEIDGEPMEVLDQSLRFLTASYTLTREGLVLKQNGAVSRWVRCP